VGTEREDPQLPDGKTGRLDARIEAMKEIWSKSNAQYHGDMVNFDEIMAWPKPVQKPYPPIVVGGGFPQAARRAIRYGDGWCPVGRSGSSLLDVLGKFRQIAHDAGRDQHSLPVTCSTRPRTPTSSPAITT
jgi:alkanesulfonate monooxygenase SsuD/methylene tetrahydromethanopterin reductase-like flavin-dependent oxidoreductase (luciferase family)